MRKLFSVVSNRGRDVVVSKNLAIAVVDDHESFRVTLVESLFSLGYEASGYASAEDYLCGMTSARFDCVITDIQMPGMSGLDLTKRLVSQGSTTPIVSITAHSDWNLEAEVIAAGGVGLLRKPFEIEDLIKCIEEGVKGKPQIPK
jgi:FixJ family two-component response regulator